MQKEQLGISQCLSNHPILNEKIQYKIKYLNVIEYFVNLYSKDDIFAQGVLKVYKKKILDDVSLYSYDEKKIKKVFKSVTGHKLKGFKLFTYRYNLLFDCFFINAFNDSQKAKQITDSIGSLFNPRYFKKIEMLYRLIYKNDANVTFEGLEYQIACWNQNKEFLSKPLKRILITANMSAGKSTLINAIIGKKVNKTRNEVCTEKVHYIFNKPFEDDLSYEWDYDLNLDADTKTLMDDNSLNTMLDISVGTCFRLENDFDKRICLIDTPGVNSFENISHKSLTEKLIVDSNYDELVYVMNAENCGTFDDKKHLSFILENVKDKPIIFVINKLDTFRKDEDSINDIIEGTKKELLEIGFKNPVICPISAYAAVLAKKSIWNELADEDQQIEYAINSKRFSTAEYDLSRYGEEINMSLDLNNKRDRAINLLINSGFINFEKILCK